MSEGDSIASPFWRITTLINQCFSLLTSYIGLPYFITTSSPAPAIPLTTAVPHISFHLPRILLNPPSTPLILSKIYHPTHPHPLHWTSIQCMGIKSHWSNLNNSRIIIKLWKETWWNTSSSCCSNNITVVSPTLRAEKRRDGRYSLPTNVCTDQQP